MPRSESRQRMETYLPGYYRYSGVMQGILDSLGLAIDGYRADMQDIVAQMFVPTATWGLDIWERELGIKTDYRISLEERRSTIIAKLRGIGTVTVGLVRQVAESYAHGRVAVTDSPYEYTYDLFRQEAGPPPYTVIIRFVDRYGIPPAMDALQRALREIIPAHLAIDYDYMYLIWDVLDAQTLTWDEQDAKVLTWDEYESGVWLNP